MKTFLTAIMIAAAATSVAAEPWSLDSCINYAISHNLTVKSRDISRKIAKQDAIDALDRFLPSVQAGASQSFSFGRGLTAENTYANRNTSNFGWQVGLSLPIFQGLRNVRNVDYSITNLEMVMEQYESAKDDITLNVMAQYLQVLYTQEIHKVALEQLNLSRTELQRRRELLDAGKIPELDLIQAESQVAQDELSAVTAQNDYTMAMLNLTQLLELPTAEGFDIQPVDESEFKMLPSAESVYSTALGINHGILASEYGVKAARKYIKVAQSGYLPTLSFSAGIGSNYYKTSGFQNEGFGPQMRHNLSKSLGFSLSIPIFDAFSTRNSVRRARLQEISATLQLDQAKNDLYKTIMQAHTQAIAAEKRRQSSEVASRSTLAALDAMREKYNYGKANATEFEQAKTEYIRAVSSAVQAKYESLLRQRILQFYTSARPLTDIRD